ncbi:NAD(P)-binding protein [Hypoxylon trugodes]|uniref:NAD(P)-binding protein n=1 Tax=Hypoxylon trugodes TaxID=326681 RepID=UPI00218EDEF5|nr:NAD(P)-binding protein [Hypoxylon trugodes]KAI1385805.1 NAD(P)-binding protein [Hypoxylon trugodes]
MALHTIAAHVRQLSRPLSVLRAATTMSTNHVLLLGGSGKVARLLTPMLLHQSWDVTSIIYNPDQIADLKQLGVNQNGKLNVLVRSLEDIKNETDAKRLIDEIKPSYVVWSAGAGGKGAPERTEAIDRDAAIHCIRASIASPYITKFVMISFNGCRYEKPPWIDETHWQEYLKVTRNHYQRYYEAKLPADEVLYVEGKKRKDFAGICLRPGRLSMEPVGKVSLGKFPRVEGYTSRASLAYTAALLLDSHNKNCWLDILDGDEDPEAAVKRCIEEEVDCAEGEYFY